MQGLAFRRSFRRSLPCYLIAVAVCLLPLFQLFTCQLDFTQVRIPTFSVGTFYPSRDSQSAIEVEEVVCRAIIDHIKRNSERYNHELVTSTNSRINFATKDSHIMSSRMQSHLDDLARSYFSSTSMKMTILKAWTPYHDTQLQGVNKSLHFEGRTVRVQLPPGNDYNKFLRMAVAAAFDWVYYESANFVRLSVIPSTCRRSIDAVFMLDRSGSVGSKNHNLALQFINTVVSFSNIGLNMTRVGFVAYSYSASIQFDLDDHTTLSNLQRAISRVEYTGGATNTPDALNHARFLLNPARYRGARPSLEGIPRIAILITDGYSNRGHLSIAAPALQNAGVQVYVVGIGDINRDQLRFIASDPDDKHVFILRNYLDAAGFVDFLSVTTCDTPAIIQPGDNTTTVITDGGIKYFQTSCTTFSSYVLVELIDISGTSFLFVSGTETNPGPLTINTVTNTTTGITRRIVILSLSGNSKVVYIGVQGQTALDKFTVIVWDQLFDPVDAFIDVVEGALRGITIYEVRRNLTAAAYSNTYTYSFIDVNEDGIFSINSSNGRVFIPTSGSPGVNYDQQRTHNLTVQAQNNAQSCQRARIRINIRVISNRITFNSIPTLQVMEDASITTSVVQVVATGGAGNIEYSIVDGNSAGDFIIDTSTGILRVNKKLDYETRRVYTLVIRANSRETAVEGELDVPISVQDINEPPVFISCTMSTNGCTFNIDENVQATLLGQIMISDPDLSLLPNGMLTYDLNIGGLPYTVDSSGNLRTTTQLDREVQSSYRFSVIIMDGCPGCALSISVDVLVTVNDLNDNSPVFTLAPTTAQVREDSQRGTVVAEYRATDADSGANTAIIFTLSAPNLPFNLSSAGTLSLNGDIDYEVTQSYTVIIIASNPGSSRSSTATTIIEILNVNDNTPLITGEPYRATVLENSGINTEVLTVTAMDADLGIHGQIQYQIIRGNFQNYFALNSNSGVLTVNRSIDRETITSISLLVEARDSGTPQSRNDRTSINITISDLNDNQPIFRPDTYSVQLLEDLPEGQNIIQVIATDVDQPNTLNSNIVYSFKSGNSADKFRILSSGQIQIHGSLDFETTSTYNLVVEAKDEGNPVMFGTANITITVIDVNENPPTLFSNQSVSVSESTSIGSVISIFQGQDKIATNFSIVSGNDEGKFMINQTRGVITLADSLDFESTIAYSLLIRMCSGQQNTEASLSVIVLDANEFSPVFSEPFDFTIKEEEQSGSIVGTIMATDGDIAEALIYTFIHQDKITENFNLDPSTGVITTIGVLNRENMMQIFTPPLSQVNVQISAKDNGLPSMQTIRDYTITLEDINDNAPTFSKQIYFNQFLENLPPGQAVFTAAAIDPDLGSNAEVSYSFTLTNNQSSSNPFEINSATGAIETAESLDCELQPFYLFTITATDGGSPSLSTNVSGNLSLIDVNDNIPRFSQETYRISVSEDFNPGDMVMTFVATDADKGVNAEVEYFIMSNLNFLFLEGASEETVFHINRVSGELITLNFFDFERAPQVNLSIYAIDGGLPKLTGTATLVIDIMNIDEEPPQFQPMSCDATVSEDISIGTIVSSCTATDQDTTATGNQRPITFSMTNQFIKVNPDNGDIITKGPLNRETNGGITVRITVTDLAGRSASRRVLIRIKDINDNPPQFRGAPYRYHFTDRAIQEYKEEFLTLQVDDPDLGSNGTFTLSIGKTLQLTDRETTVEVIAQDSGSPQMTNSVNITVTFQSPCQLQTYSITSEGRLSARLLCAIEVTPALSFPVVLGRSGSLSCRIVRNTPTEYQWLHNSSILTNNKIIGESTGGVSLPLTNVRFNQAGEYACKASSQAGSLQSLASTAIIHVSPIIITSPQDTTVEEGGIATFTCSAVGIPPPTIQWFKGTEHLGEGSVFTITDVDSSRVGTYTCGVGNAAGDAAASATLIVFGAFNVVQLQLININNPNREGSCHDFDFQKLVTTINSVTNLKVMVTKVSGSNLCDLTPCSPSPCNNGGTCSLKEDVKGGYECTCRLGDMGHNCSMDVDECDRGECGMDGECSNTKGSFICNCKQNITGRRCQFEEKCSNNPCSGQGKLCLEDFTSQGYHCHAQNGTSSLTVGEASVTMELLNDLVQAFVDGELQAAPTTTEPPATASKKLTTQCEPKFSPFLDGSILLWVCPPDEPQPSPEQQRTLCTYLLALPNVVTQCKPPLGAVMTTPTISSLPTTSVNLFLILVDDTNWPIDASDSVKFLEAKLTQEELAKNGFTVPISGVQRLEPHPEKQTTNIDAIVGGTVMAFFGLVIVAVVFLVVIISRAAAERTRQQKKREKAFQLMQLPGISGAANISPNDKSPVSTNSLRVIRELQNSVSLLKSSRKDDTAVTASINGEVDTTDDYDRLPEKQAKMTAIIVV